MFPTFRQFQQLADETKFPDRGRDLLLAISRHYGPAEREAQLEEARKLTNAFKSGADGIVRNMHSNKAGEQVYWAYYYWLHAEQIDSAELEELDALVKLDSSGWLIRPKPINAYFSRHWSDDGLYTTQPSHLHGRAKQREALRSFLATNEPYKWLQIAGEGGQGKTYLAADFIDEVARGGEWHAGFITDLGLDEFRERWSKWKPRKPTLIVIDDVQGREALVSPAFRYLLQRTVDSPKVRLLLLERQRWDRGGYERHLKDSDKIWTFRPSDRGRAGWFLKICNATPSGPDDLPPYATTISDAAFNGGVLELASLDTGDAVLIVLDAVKRGGATIGHTAPQLRQLLQRVDPSLRPISAKLLGDGLSRSAADRDISLERLLTSYLEREQERWRPNGDGLISGRALSLARLASMTGGFYSKIAAERIEDTEWGQVTPTVVEEAVTVVGAATGNRARPYGYVPALTPGLLAEWFVLSAFIGGDSDATELTKAAWRLQPNATAAFVLRCVQDFPRSPEVVDLVSVDLPSTQSRETYAEVVADIATILVESTKDPMPPAVLRELYFAADRLAMPYARTVLGRCFLFGLGVEKNEREGHSLLWAAAEADNADAMYVLAGAYERGLEIVAADPDMAVTFLHTAAAEGHPGAQLQLGKRYLSGDHNLSVNLELAFAYFLKSALAGNLEAMREVSTCYRDGIGVPQSMIESMVWWARAELAEYPADAEKSYDSVSGFVSKARFAGQ